MRVKRNRKRDRKNAKKEKKPDWRWVVPVRRGVFFTLIAGLLGFFIYNNIDYFVTLVEKHGPESKAEGKPKEPAKPREHRSVEEIVGGPEFTADGNNGRGTEIVPLNRWIEDAQADAGTPEQQPADMAPAPLPGLHTADLTTPVSEPKPDSQMADADAPRPLAMSPISLTAPEPEPPQARKPEPEPLPPVKKPSSIQWPSISWTTLASIMPKSSPSILERPYSDNDSISQRTNAVDTAAGRSVDKKAAQPVDYKKENKPIETMANTPVDTKAAQLPDWPAAEADADSLPVKKPSVMERLPSIRWPQWLTLTSLTSLITKSSPETPEHPHIENDSVSQLTSAVDTAASQSADKKEIQPVDDKKAGQIVNTKTGELVDTMTIQPINRKTSQIVDTKTSQQPGSWTAEADADSLPVKKPSVMERLSSIQWPQWLSLTSLTSLMPKLSQKTLEQPHIENDSVSQRTSAHTSAVDTAANQSADNKTIPPVDKKNSQLADTKTDTAADTKSNQVADTKKSVDNKTGHPVDTKSNQAADAKVAAKPAGPKAGRNSIFLPEIHCKLADRDDLNIRMSIELYYDDNSGAAFGDELYFKRGTLALVASDVTRRYEHGSVDMALLSADLLSSFNVLLKEGRLSGVDIKDFSVEQVAAR
jgi:uncharacterized protein YqcC (DUF446 family)